MASVLTHRYREQARSHRVSGMFVKGVLGAQKKARSDAGLFLCCQG